jgi:hypothetical protein
LCKIEPIIQGQKSKLYNLSEVPLIIINPDDFLEYKAKMTTDNFKHWNSTFLLDEITPQLEAFRNKISSCCLVKTFGYCYDNKFLLVLKGNENETTANTQSNDIYINLVPNIMQEKLDNIKNSMKNNAMDLQNNINDIQDVTNIENKETNPNNNTQISDTQVSKKYKIKLVCNWDSSQNLYNNWEKMETPGVVDLVYTNDNDYDFLVVINKPNCEYNPKNTIVYRMEPYIETNKFYNDWINTDKSKFMYFLEHDQFRNNTEWWLSKTDCEEPKNKVISTVVSSQYDMVGHKFRIDFLKYFQEHSKIPIDVFGYENRFGFQNYMGPLPVREKDNGIFPYKYTFAVENCDITNYFTEKLYDAIIGECLCFYWGCNNVEEFINPQAFIRLDKDDFKKSLQIIEDAIANDEWSKRLEIIRQEKQKIINYFNIFTRTSSLIYMNKHMEFYINNEVNENIPFINNKGFSPKEIELLGDSKKQALEYLRKFDNPLIKLSEYSNILQHIDLWEKCSQGDKPFCVILGKVKNNFVDHLCTTLSKYWNSIEKLDLIFLHQNPSNGYIITPEGAKNLLSVTHLYGIFSSLDNILKFSNSDFPNVAGISDKNLVQEYTFGGRLFIHLFYIINGMLDNSPDLFKNRDFSVLNNLNNKIRDENLTLLLDF